jgi:hypothetical protein
MHAPILLNHNNTGLRVHTLAFALMLGLVILAPRAMAEPAFITVYQDCNFGGYAVKLPPGSYDLAELNRRGIRNDDLSALRVPPGWKVTLYEHAGFSGRSLVVTTDNRCLVEAGFNDLTSSLRVERLGMTHAKPPISAVGKGLDGLEAHSARPDRGLQIDTAPIVTTPQTTTTIKKHVAPIVTAKPPITTMPAPTVAAVAADPYAKVDAILAAMDTANIAFNSPGSINLQDTAQIQLLLSLQKSIDELSAALTAAGAHEGASIKVANRMLAQLTGADFKITPITAEEQAIGATDTTEWKWEIKPTATGQHNLHLTLTAIISVDGATTRKSIKTFDKIIQVDVTTGQVVTEFLGKYWQWLWAVVLVPIVGWLMNKWKRK